MLNVISLNIPSGNLNSALLAAEMQTDCVRLFHPAFPDEILHPLPMNEICHIYEMKQMLRIDSDLGHKSYMAKVKSEELLPWKILPSLGLVDTKKSFSTSLIQDVYESVRPYGYIVWLVHFSIHPYGYV